MFCLALNVLRGCHRAAITPVEMSNRAADPAAVYVAKLFGTMSYRDQAWANTVKFWLLSVAGVVGYAAGWYFEAFSITVYVVGAAAAATLLVCVPNWRQRPDSENTHWLDRKTVRDFYAALDEAEVEATKKANAKPKTGLAALWHRLLPARPRVHNPGAKKPTEAASAAPTSPTSPAEAKKKQ